MTLPFKDQFLSEEDLDLKNLSEDEFLSWWDLWLHQAQSSNDDDSFEYSHGVFTASLPGHPINSAVSAFNRNRSAIT